MVPKTRALGNAPWLNPSHCRQQCRGGMKSKEESQVLGKLRKQTEASRAMQEMYGPSHP